MYSEFGKMGERVLGFAIIELPNDGVNTYSISEQNYPTSGLTFVGLMAMMDPPKRGVMESVDVCKRAGVKIFMVTGDHPFTAEAIARKVHIIDKHKTKKQLAKERGVQENQIDTKECGAAVIYGPDMANFNQEQWNDLIYNKQELVFARITPLQKVEIVEQFQNAGEIVAVTGDGVNDAIALKKANIGIAMGIGGNDVAKEAADVIFMDDNFNSIVVGIEEGRLLFDNLKKTIAYTLTHLIPEVIPILLNLALSLPLGINSLLILTIDLGTEIAPAVAVAYEDCENDIMVRPPRNAHTDRLVSTRLMVYSYLIAGFSNILFCLIAYFMVFADYGLYYSDIAGSADDYWGNESKDFIIERDGVKMIFNKDKQNEILAKVQTAWYVTLVMGQFGHIWWCRTRKLSIFSHGFFRNKYINIGVLIELFIVAFIVYVPGVQEVFGTGNIEFKYWTLWLGNLGIMGLYNEIRKYYNRKYPENQLAESLSW